MSQIESRLREAEHAAGARVTDAGVVEAVASTRSRARRIRAVRTASTFAITALAGVAGLAVGWWALGDSRAPAATTDPTAPQYSEPSSPAASEGLGIVGLPTMIPVDPDLVAQYLDPVDGPALVTGAMPETADYGDAALACGEVREECDHPAAPGLTSAVLHDADERWAVAWYSQAWSGVGPGSTGGGGGMGPAGLYLVGPDGQAAFVAAGDPAIGPIDEGMAVGLAWAPGRESAVVGGGLSSDGAGGFTLVNLLSGRTTTVFGECAGVQAIAQDDGWLLRASCPGGAVVAVVSDAGDLIPTDGLLVADRGFAVNVDGSYLIAIHEGDGAASAYYALTPAGDAQISGTDCYPTDNGRYVVCSESGAMAVTEVSDSRVVKYTEDPALLGASSLEICTVGDTTVRRVGIDEPEYVSTILVGDSGTSITVDPLTASQNLSCTSAGGGTGYFAGDGGVWSFDSTTLATTQVIAAPSDTFPVEDDWQHPGVRMVFARAVVGGSSFLSIG